MTDKLAARLPGFDEEIQIHVNGCPNSCARFRVADIGLISALRVRPDGTKSDAFLIHLGGTMGDAAAQRYAACRSPLLPFCGEPTIRPADPSGWRCESCDRTFELSLVHVGGSAT